MLWGGVRCLRIKEYEGEDGMKDGEGINQRTLMHNLWTQMTMWGRAWGGGRVGLVEVGKGRKSWNNCNSINNKNLKE